MLQGEGGKAYHGAGCCGQLLAFEGCSQALLGGVQQQHKEQWSAVAAGENLTKRGGSIGGDTTPEG